MKIKHRSNERKRNVPRRSSRVGRTNTAGRKLMVALQEIIEGERNGGRGLTVRKVQIPAPHEYDPAGVRVLIERLGISTDLFAQLIGVSSERVEAWKKNDRRKPSRTARRLFDLIAADPTSVLQTLMVHHRVGIQAERM